MVLETDMLLESYNQFLSYIYMGKKCNHNETLEHKSLLLFELHI